MTTEVYKQHGLNNVSRPVPYRSNRSDESVIQGYFVTIIKIL